MTLRVGILFADNAGCGMYRCALPALQARSLGYDVQLLPQIDARVVNGEVKGVPPMPYDVLVYQRPMRGKLVDTIPFVQAQGIRVVVELDDDLEATSPANAAYNAVHPKKSPDVNWQHMRRAITMADLVTVSTDSLKQRYGGDKAVVVPNFVPKQLLDQKRPKMERQDGAPLDDQLRIGWAGMVAYHPYDLQETSGAVAEVMEATGAAFRVVGDGVAVPGALGLTRGTFEMTGWVPIHQYPEAVSTIDVGIVPLEDSVFNRGKSWLKGLEMAAVGVPFVASPLPEYRKLHSYGIGLLAHNRSEWYDLLMRLVKDPGYRSDIAAQGREAVRSVPLTIEGNGHLWVTAWDKATKKLIVPGGLGGAPRKA